MPVYTKTPHDVCAPTDASGKMRSVDNGDMETLLTEITVAISDLEDSANVPVIARSTWADLAALTGEKVGHRAEVVGPDAGTHTDPVVGGTVDNEGVYAWSTSPAGWQRLSDRDTADAVRADVGTNPNGSGASPTVFETLETFTGLGTLASATTIDLSSVANRTVTITGDVPIGTLGTLPAGEVRTLRCTGSPIFYHGSSLILPAGQDFYASPGDALQFVSEGAGVWSLIGCITASGKNLVIDQPNWLSRLFADDPLLHRERSRGRYAWRGKAYGRASDFDAAAGVNDGVLNVGPHGLPRLFAADFNGSGFDGFVTSRDATLSLVAGRMRITNGTTSYGAAKLAFATKVGKSYRVDFKIAKVTGTSGRLLVRDSNDPETGTLIASSPSHTSTTEAYYTLTFTAASGLTWITFGNDTNGVGDSIDVDDVKIFATAGVVPYGVKPVLDDGFRGGIGTWRGSRGAVVWPVFGRWMRVTNGANDYGAGKLSLPTIPGRTYRVDYTTRMVTGGGVSLVVRDGNDPDLGAVLVQGANNTLTSEQRFSDTFVAASASTWITFANGANGVGDAGEVTDVQVYPVLGSAAPSAGGRVHVRATTGATNGNDQTIWQIDDGTESNRARIVWAADQHLYAVVTSGGVTQAQIDLGTVGYGGATFSVDFMWTLNGVFARLNDGLFEGDKVAALPVNAVLVRAGSGPGGATPFTGTINDEAFWPTTGFANEDVTYPSSIDPDLFPALKARLCYPMAGDDLPILVLMHGFAQSIASFGAGHDPQLYWAQAGFFVVTVGMRGNDDLNDRDAGGREVYDIADAVDWVRAHYPQASKTRAGIAGYSGGGGNVFSCAARFPDLFQGYAAHFGISSYSDWHASGAYAADLEALIGGTPAAKPAEYRARESRDAIPYNLQSGKLFIFSHDPDSGGVPPEQSTDMADAMDAASNTRYSISITTDSSPHPWWAHGLPEVNYEVRYSFPIWAPAFLAMERAPYPRRGTVKVRGWLRTGLFEIRLGDMQSQSADIDYDVDAGTYTITPVLPSSVDVTILQADGRSYAGTVTGVQTVIAQ